ncbi:MAG: B12-binding domain-containing radical SAM protein, partial [Gemmatimonadota bacterium]
RPITDIPGLRVRDAGFQARTQITDLDELGMMAFDGLEQLFAQSPPAHRVAFLLGGRGCYANCGFCSVPAFTRQSSSARPWRGRSVALVVDEMELIAKSFGVRRFVFQDENFFGPGQAGRERARRLAAEILRRGLEIEYFVACRVNDVDAETLRAMKLSGLTRVGLGVESMNQASLSLFRKGYRAEAIRPALKVIGEIGIACEVNLIFFEPLMNVADVRRNLDFLEFVRKERWLTYSDGLPFKTLFVAPWLPIAGTLAAQGALEQDGTTCRFRDSRVAALAEFANRLQACMPVVFKQRGIIMRKEGLCAAEGTAGTVREIASYTERLREWLGLVVLPRYLRAACSAVEQRPADVVPRLAELATAFDGEMAALRHLGERLEEIVAERTGGQR